LDDRLLVYEQESMASKILLSKLAVMDNALSEVFLLCTEEEAHALFIEMIMENTDFKILKSILPYININCGNHESKKGAINPLLYACANKNLELVKFLIENGADVNQLSYYDTTPIMFSYQKGDYETFMYLYKHGAIIRPTTTTKLLSEFPPPTHDLMTTFIQKLVEMKSE